MKKMKMLMAFMIIAVVLSCGQPKESNMSKLNVNSGSLAAKRDQMNAAADTTADSEARAGSVDTNQIR